MRQHTEKGWYVTVTGSQLLLSLKLRPGCFINVGVSAAQTTFQISEVPLNSSILEFPPPAPPYTSQYIGSIPWIVPPQLIRIPRLPLCSLLGLSGSHTPTISSCTLHYFRDVAWWSNTQCVYGISPSIEIHFVKRQQVHKPEKVVSSVVTFR